MSGPIVLTAGGTGGHVFPAEALGAELRRRGRDLVLITDRRAETYERRFPGMPIHVVRSAGIAGRGLAGQMRAAAEIGLGFITARSLLKRIEPAAVIGFGGYASLPAMLAAQSLGVATLLHEQNAVAGRANRLVAGRAAAIATSFVATAGLAAEVETRTIVTGNPVRPAIVALRDLPYRAPEPGGPVRILVMGGSLGATVMSDVVPAALAMLDPGLRARLVVTQQARSEDLARVSGAYEAAGIAAAVLPFIDDVPARLGDCHLAITRAGASTVSELTVAGRPAVLVPYPSAVDDHQTANARALSDQGAALLMAQSQFTPADLVRVLNGWIADPVRLSGMAAAARAIGRPLSAAALADLVERFAPANGRSNPEPRRNAA